MGLITRYTAIDKIVPVATGNSLVICGDETALNTNTSDMITINDETTREWQQAGSTAKLNIAQNSTILYAELTWYSTVKSDDSTALDVRSIQDEAITFDTPKDSYQVTPQFTESITGASGNIDRFRSAVVTDIIKEGLIGNYTVSKVPTSIPPENLSKTRAGWSLVVFYRNELFKPRKVIFSSGIGNANSTTPLQTTITGFSTPNEEDKLHGYIYFACANGQPLDGTETVKVGPSFATLGLQGNPVTTPNANPGTSPNNPINSFFGGQINICDPLQSENNGLINISGTNGTKNHNTFIPKQVIGGRNKWDITNIDISNTLVVNQNQLALQVSESSGLDGVMLVGVGTVVDTIAPDITTTFNVFDVDGALSKTLSVGEEAIYSLKIRNSGDTEARNVIISTILDQSTTFVSGSLKVNGQIIEGSSIINGINIGTIPVAGVINVMFSAHINSLPPSKKLNAYIDYNYSFTSGSGSPTTTNYATTSIVNIDVKEAKVIVTKTASNLTPKVNDRVNYNVVIENIGTQNASNILFQDIITKYSTFVTGSVKVNGIRNQELNPITGISLPDMNSGDSITINFDIDIKELPPSKVINSYSKLTMDYQYYTSGPYFTRTIYSNILNVQIQYIDIVGERCINNDYPKVGDKVTYTLSLNNIGNMPTTNIQIAETPIQGAIFVEGTVNIDGVNKPLLNPFTGFTVDTISPNQKVNIKYDMAINTVDAKRLIENIARVPFKYQIEQSNPLISDERVSNKVTTMTSFVNIGMVETVDKEYGGINDILYYSVTLTNTGNIDAIDTIFMSAIQSETSFIPGSVAINGVLQSSFNPNAGFSIGTLCTNNSTVVTYQAKANSLPNPNVIYNKSQLTYGYLPDPNGIPRNNTVNSNTVQTEINKMEFTITKNVNKFYAEVKDVLIYSIDIANTGTVVLKNVKFIDMITPYLTLIPGEVYLNGVKRSELNPNDGFRLEDIHPGDTTRVSLAVTINTVPPAGYILNNAKLVYTYQVNSSSDIITNTTSSNDVKTYVVNGDLSIIKTVNKTYATLNDTLSYSFNISNTGNVIDKNIYFTDIIPDGALFINGTVKINGIIKADYNPNIGFPLDNLNSGEVINVTFDAKVSNVLNPNTIINSALVSFNYDLAPNNPPKSKTVSSNTVTTVINIATSTLTKMVDKLYATIDDIVTYTLVARNTGTVDLTNILFKDILPNGLLFVAGSVIVDGVAYNDYNPNIGFERLVINPSGNITVSFKAKVISVLKPNTIINRGTIDYKYKLNPTAVEETGSKTSNDVTTVINRPVVSSTKAVDKGYATINDLLTYTCVVENKGNINVTDVVFKDLLPIGIKFEEGTVKINGTSEPTYDPLQTFTLGTIAPTENVVVEFKARVISLPAQGYIYNTFNVEYNYKINPTEAVLRGTSTSNQVTTLINVGSLTITKSNDRDYARKTDLVNYTFVIKNTGNVTLKNISFIDAIQSESIFNENSVYIDAVNKPGLNPNTGFIIDDLIEGDHKIITFSVTVKDIPLDGKLYNTGSITHGYNIDPNNPPIIKTITSNQTVVNINDAIVSGTKSVNKSQGKIGDELIYSVKINNSGSTAAENMFFRDLLDSNISFVSGSVNINGSVYSELNPNTGFNLPNIEAGGNNTVSFKVTVLSRPANNIVYNLANINYQYKVNPEDQYIDIEFTTNKVETLIAMGELTVVKAVDRDYAPLGNALIYSVTINNTGSVNATNINFNDLIEANLSFIAGSVMINGVNKPALNPNAGFIIDDLLPSHSTVISFVVTIANLPSTGKVENFAEVIFSYKLTDLDQIQTKTTNSNTVITYVKLGRLNITKTVDKAYATVGDKLNYTINLTNEGSARCSILNFIDIIQSEANFDIGTVKVNDITYENYNPNRGFSLPDIDPNETTKVTFTITVGSVPADSLIKNFAKIDYSYYVDPTKPIIDTSTTSNTVQTQINVGNITLNKTVNLNYATINDVIIYTITVNNTGNVDALYVNFRDIVKDGLTFVNNSVSIDGISKPGFSPFDSFTLGTIKAGDSVVVKFKATVTSVPTPTTILNIANATFSYKIDPLGLEIINEVTSNTVVTQINLSKLDITKAVDKVYGTVGDILNYSFVIKNSGNVNTTNVTFNDVFLDGISFNTGSVIVNGVEQPSYDPTVGFSIGNIDTLGQVTLSFKATITALPRQQAILNLGTINYNYKIDPQGQDYSKATDSNMVVTYVKIGQLSSTKTVNFAYVTIQNELLYNIIVTNIGNTNGYNLFFTDMLSSGAIFIDGSVNVDGIVKPSFNPITGFYLTDLIPGNTSNISFKAKVTTLPTPAQVTNYATTVGNYKIDPAGPDYNLTTTSNTVKTDINVGDLNLVKSVDKLYARVTDTLSYSNTLTNTGNVIATGVKFIDNLQPEISFVSGTVRINEVIYPNANPSLGIDLGSLAPSQSALVEFDVKINTLPIPPIVQNYSQGQFSYKIDPNASNIIKTNVSNIVSTNVVLGELAAVKTVDKSIATINDELNYTIVITNKGNTIASDVFFQDTPSTGGKFKVGSVVVNGTLQESYDPTIGFNLGSIGVGNVITVKFVATVDSVPVSNKIANQATINFKYLVDPKQPALNKTTTSNLVTTNVALGNLTVTKAVNKLYATIGDKLTYTVIITNVGNIDATNVNFLDATPENSVYVLGSVTVNGTNYPQYNPEAGFDLGIVSPGQIITVVYMVEVTN
ncbi:DUF7507 domain-containing protein [Clostridium sp.]|uniref:DUF7507 domain-containing protein n=1 Tax=Clostridium sp. TaxID=1506 RepID=UPI003F3241FD